MGDRKFRSERKARRKAVRLRALAMLRQHGVMSVKNYGNELERIAGLPVSSTRGGNYAKARRALAILESGGKITALPTAAAKVKSIESAQRFYASYEWRKLRYKVLLTYGRKCMCCGSVDGPFHVDHIKSLRFNWSLRLDETNLQVLCEVCNHGKGNWDATDHRAVQL